MDIIENIKRVTPLGAFFFKALSLQTYGLNLFWEDQSTLTWCLRCTHKKKKDYTETVEKIFKDYRIYRTKDKKNKAKPNGDKDLRTALLNALKKNPYIAIDEERSSNDEKFCSFTARFETVCARFMRQVQLVPDPVEEMIYIDPVEEFPDSFTAVREDVTLYYEDMVVEEPYSSSFNHYSTAIQPSIFADVVPHDNQFCLPIEDESILLADNHCRVTEKENQQPKSAELLNGSCT